MTDHLLEAVKAHPKDMELVRVRADKLLEEGNPFGEAIVTVLHEMPDIRKLLNEVHRQEAALYAEGRRVAKHDINSFGEAHEAKRVQARIEQTYQLFFSAPDLTFATAAWTNFKRDYLPFRQGDGVLFLHDWSERPHSYSSISSYVHHYGAAGLTETLLGDPGFKDAAKELERFYIKIMKILRSSGLPIPTIRSIAAADVVRRFSDGRYFSWAESAESYHMATKAFGYETEVRDGSQILSWLARVANRSLMPGKSEGTTVRRWRLKAEYITGQKEEDTKGQLAAEQAGLRNSEQILNQYKRTRRRR